MNTQLEELIGWFSSKQAEVGGSSIYEDMEGNEVEVTEVTQWTRCEPNPAGIWDDYVCLGPIGRYVKDGRRGVFYDMEKRLEKYVRLDEIGAKKDPELVGFYTYKVIWSDLNDLEERVIMNFYTTPSGVRSVEIDYQGALVRDFKKGDDLDHLRRLWIDANTLPLNTKFVGKF